MQAKALLFHSSFGFCVKLLKVAQKRHSSLSKGGGGGGGKPYMR